MLIPLGWHLEKVCTKCQEEIMDWVSFPNLEGQPTICERCIVEALGVGRREWTATFVASVMADRAHAAARSLRSLRSSWWRRLV